MKNEHTTVNLKDANARRNKMIRTVVFLLEMAYALARANLIQLGLLEYQ
jgi:hypothetical protein